MLRLLAVYMVKKNKEIIYALEGFRIICRIICKGREKCQVGFEPWNPVHERNLVVKFVPFFFMTFTMESITLRYMDKGPS